jgi:hypothetical protein
MPGSLPWRLAAGGCGTALSHGLVRDDPDPDFLPPRAGHGRAPGLMAREGLPSLWRSWCAAPAVRNRAARLRTARRNFSLAVRAGRAGFAGAFHFWPGKFLAARAARYAFPVPGAAPSVTAGRQPRPRRDPTGERTVNDISPDLARAVHHAVIEMEASLFVILDRHWQSGGHALELVAAVPGKVLIVVDVQPPGAGYLGRDLADLGEERIGEFRGAAEAWNAGHGGRYEQIRVDVIGWTGDGTGQLAIEHVWEAG